MLRQFLQSHPTLDKVTPLDSGVSIHGQHIVNVLTILHRQMLKHQFHDAALTMESISMVMDRVPDAVQKAGIECLLHNDEAYGECLQLYKHLFSKQSSQRQEILVEMSLFQIKHGKLVEAYDTLHSQISVPPYKTNPLLHGYCGVVQYMLWNRAISEESAAGVSDTEEALDEFFPERQAKKGSSASAHAKRAMVHFEHMEDLNWTCEDNMEAFISLHVYLLETLGSHDEAFSVLLQHRERFPNAIVPNRCLCNHIRKYRHDNNTLLEQHLRQLVAVDDSCEEAVEYVELLLLHEAANYEWAFEVMVKHLDYPVNGSSQQAWDLLQHIQQAWPEYKDSKLWAERREWWTLLYPQHFNHEH